jgi:glycerol-3-phosphate dehydrogenase (NAD(P)+)
LKVAVLGGGSWGTSLAVLLHSSSHLVKVWEFYPERARAMREARENVDMLPGIKIPDEIVITSEMDEAVIRMDVVTVVVPSHGLRATVEKATPFLKGNETLVIATKGIEQGTLKRMSEVTREVTGFPEDRIAVLVGPSHAEEVSRGVPTLAVSASASEATAKRIQDVFMTPTFRVYTNTDVVGVECGASLKNVIAIAAGVCDGLGFGDNAKGALLTRGLAEMTRLGVKMGARQTTFSGLAGLGDMVTTCISTHSRNRYVGHEVGKGKTIKEVLSGMVMVAEGVRTTKSAVDLAERHQVEMPIAAEVFNILFKDKPVKEAIRDLMLRSPKPEIWW